MSDWNGNITPENVYWVWDEIGKVHNSIEISNICQCSAGLDALKSQSNSNFGKWVVKIFYTNSSSLYDVEFLDSWYYFWSTSLAKLFCKTIIGSFGWKLSTIPIGCLSWLTIMIIARTCKCWHRETWKCGRRQSQTLVWAYPLTGCRCGWDGRMILRMRKNRHNWKWSRG